MATLTSGNTLSLNGLASATGQTTNHYQQQKETQRAQSHCHHLQLIRLVQ
jgi:hypothetical protein